MAYFGTRNQAVVCQQPGLRIGLGLVVRSRVRVRGLGLGLDIVIC